MAAADTSELPAGFELGESSPHAPHYTTNGASPSAPTSIDPSVPDPSKPPAEPTVLLSRPLNRDEESEVDCAYREPVDTTRQLQESAKILMTLAAVSAIILASLLGSFVRPPGVGVVERLLPFGFLFFALLAFVSVLFPLHFVVNGRTSTALTRSLITMRRRRFLLLAVGIALFVAGLASQALLLAQ